MDNVARAADRFAVLVVIGVVVFVLRYHLGAAVGVAPLAFNLAAGLFVLAAVLDVWLAA